MVTLNYTATYSSTLYYPNGDIYVGQVHTSATNIIVPHGYGSMTKVNGETYTGSFYEGLRHGQGQSYNAASQRHYLGTYNCDQEEGYATITRPAANGGQRQFTGYMVRNQRHGSGRQWETTANGQSACFEGIWTYDQLSGPGKFTIQGVGYGHLCEGTFVNGQLEGLGTMTDTVTGTRYSVRFQGGTAVQFYNVL